MRSASSIYNILTEFIKEQQEVTDKFSRILANLNSNKTPLNLKKRSSIYNYKSNSNKEQISCQHCGKHYTSKLPLRNHIERYHERQKSEEVKSVASDKCPISQDEIREKLIKNVQAIEKREQTQQIQESEDVVISGIESNDDDQE